MIERGPQFDEAGGDEHLARAISTARQHIPIQKAVAIESAWNGYTLTRQKDGTVRPYEDRAFVEQHESLLPWSMPPGVPVGHVDITGQYSPITDGRPGAPKKARRGD